VTKGAETRERIVEHAARAASVDGLTGITIGNLASGLGLSKSGLIAHFGSKEELQVQVLEKTAERFRQKVLEPAFRARRGEPRIRALFDRWIEWISSSSAPGGCVFVSASVELDDRAGKPRDHLVAAQRQLLATVARAAQIAKEEQHFRSDLDTEQFAYEFFAIVLGFHFWKRLLRDHRAGPRAREALERLVSSAHP
jgi:AcrR family transcriptional regulator